jgi:hypothetical protein
MAAYEGRVDVVKLLLEHGADPNIQNEDGRTPLHKAAFGAVSKLWSFSWRMGRIRP